MLSRRPCSLGFSTPSALTNLMAFVMLQPKGGVVADSISRMCGDLHVDFCGGVNWALGKR